MIKINQIPLDNKRRIVFPRKVAAAQEKCRTAADIALEVNKALCAIWIPVHIRIQRLTYNEMSNLSGLMETAATNGMLLPLHQELLLWVVKEVQPRDH